MGGLLLDSTVVDGNVAPCGGRSSKGHPLCTSFMMAACVLQTAPSRKFSICLSDLRLWLSPGLWLRGGPHLFFLPTLIFILVHPLLTPCRPAGPQEVILTGTFDNWSKSLPLVKTADGSFELTVPLPVTHEPKIFYKYVVDGEWSVSPTQKIAKDDSGIENNVLYTDELFGLTTKDTVIPESGLPITSGNDVNTTVMPKEEPHYTTLAGEPGIQIPTDPEALAAFNTIRDVDPKSLNGGQSTIGDVELSAEEKKKQKKKVKKSKYKAKKKGRQSPLPGVEGESVEEQSSETDGAATGLAAAAATAALSKNEGHNASDAATANTKSYDAANAANAALEHKEAAVTEKVPTEAASAPIPVASEPIEPAPVVAEPVEPVAAEPAEPVAQQKQAESELHHGAVPVVAAALPLAAGAGIAGVGGGSVSASPAEPVAPAPTPNKAVSEDPVPITEKEAAAPIIAPVVAEEHHTLDPKAAATEESVEEHPAPSVEKTTAPVESVIPEQEVDASPDVPVDTPKKDVEPETEEIVITQGNIHNPKAAIAAAEGDVIVEEIRPTASEAARLTKEAHIADAESSTIPTATILEHTSHVITKNEGKKDVKKDVKKDSKKDAKKEKKGFFSKLKKIFN